MKVSPGLWRYLSKLLDLKASEKLEQYAKFSPSPVSIRHFLEYGRSASCETSYLFLRKEIPVRLANIMKELELLPDALQRQVPCAQIQDFYVQSFNDILQFERAGNDAGVHRAFASTLKAIRHRHIDTVPMMADAVMRAESEIRNDERTESCIQYFLDRLYMSRISIHMLIHQHGLIYDDEKRSNDKLVGCIDPECNVVEIVQDAFANASFLVDQHYLSTAKLNVRVINSDPNTVTFVYVPSHLYYILFELFKNALRATVEAHPGVLTVPDVEVLVVKSPHDVSIKISDQGGGIPRDDIEHLFKYMYTTAEFHPPSPSWSSTSTSATTTPVAGLGYGLPLSRLYARYFHGDIVLSSLDGYGTDATVYLRALCDEASEVLPVYNTMTKLIYEKARPLSSDWTDPTANLDRLLIHRTKVVLRSTYTSNNNNDSTTTKSSSTEQKTN